MESRTGAQTASRALRVLGALVDGPPPVSLTDLTQRTGLNRSATYRLVRTLEADGYVQRGNGVGSYEVGAGLLRLAARVMQTVDVRAIARPALERIVQLTGETASLHVRVGNVRVCLDSVEGIHPIRRIVPVGDTTPLYSGPSGKTILAFLSGEEQQGVLEVAERSGVARDRLSEQLRKIRSEGFAALESDRHPGVASLAIPVFDDRRVVACVTVSGPALRWTQTTMLGVAEAVKSEVNHLSVLLGGVPVGIGQQRP